MITNKTKGLFACLSANFLWGSGILFWTQLSYLGNITVLSQRMIWSCIFALVLLMLTKRLKNIKEIFQQPRVLFTLMFAASILCINWSSYLWSLNNNKALEASFGYYITPILNIFMARIFLKEPISNLQIIAIFFASFAVLYGIFSYGEIPVLGIIIGLSFAIYGYLHKIVAVDAISALFIETLCVVPFALVWLNVYAPQSLNIIGFGIKPYLLILGMIFFTGVPLMLFGFAAKNLQLTSIGFLQYLSPSINFLLAVFIIGEPIKPADYITFPLVWFALSIYSWDMLIRYRKIPKALRNTSV